MPAVIRLDHNKRRSKSRAALALLKGRNVEDEALIAAMTALGIL